MSIEIRPCRTVEEVRDALNGIGHYFGDDNDLESAERFTQRLEIERMHAAWDGDRIVGGAGAFTYRMSVPGGSIPCGGVTVVGVLPTHRRRGVLTGLMREQLADCRARGEPAAYLWASESTIYPRFGYGLAALMGDMRLARERTAFAQPFEPRGAVRLVDVEEAARTFPPLYEQMFAQRPGLFSRTNAWWEGRRLVPSPWEPKTAKRLALLELDGEPAGYAIYTVNQDWAHGSSAGKVTVVEAVAPTPEATRELWRWLLDFDWTSGVRRGPAAARPSAVPAPRRAAAHAVRGGRRDLAAADRRRSGARRAQLRGRHAGRRRADGRVPAGERGALAARRAWGGADERGRRAGARHHRPRLRLPGRLLVRRPRAQLCARPSSWTAPWSAPTRSSAPRSSRGALEIF